MNSDEMPLSYQRREQAYLKHTILKAYLQRLFLIVGKKKEDVINYVDCFSGPWQAGDEKLGDTSIGVSLEQMSNCQIEIERIFNRKIKFRALYIEKSPEAFSKLQLFLAQNSYPEIETQCLNGDYTDFLEDIVTWCGSGFTFFFIDPKGWQNVVGARTMRPLLELRKAEFLINLMYDFVNRFVGMEKHAGDMDELFGQIPKFTNETPEQRQEIILTLYRNNLKHFYRGRSAYVAIEKPGKNRVHYYLVYLTRHPKGLDVFKTEAQKMNIVQRITHSEVRLRRQFKQSGTEDMFAGEQSVDLSASEYIDNRYMARQYLLDELANGPVLIDIDKWADFLEESNLYPSDFQAAMGGLLKEGIVRNLDADVTRRRSKFIHPHWPNKSEKWALIN